MCECGVVARVAGNCATHAQEDRSNGVAVEDEVPGRVGSCASECEKNERERKLINQSDQ